MWKFHSVYFVWQLKSSSNLSEFLQSLLFYLLLLSSQQVSRFLLAIDMIARKTLASDKDTLIHSVPGVQGREHRSRKWKEL